MTGVVDALDRLTVKLALLVPLLPSATVTFAIETVGGVAGGLPDPTPFTLRFVGVRRRRRGCLVAERGALAAATFAVVKPCC